MPKEHRISGSLSPAAIRLVVVHYTDYLMLSQLCRAKTLLPNQTMSRRGAVNTVSESKHTQYRCFCWNFGKIYHYITVGDRNPALEVLKISLCSCAGPELLSGLMTWISM